MRSISLFGILKISCGHSTPVVCHLPKVKKRVRFPLPAHRKGPAKQDYFYEWKEKPLWSDSNRGRQPSDERQPSVPKGRRFPYPAHSKNWRRKISEPYCYKYGNSLLKIKKFTYGTKLNPYEKKEFFSANCVYSSDQYINDGCCRIFPDKRSIQADVSTHFG